jgi:hypothetical protein
MKTFKIALLVFWLVSIGIFLLHIPFKILHHPKALLTLQLGASLLFIVIIVTGIYYFLHQSKRNS